MIFSYNVDLILQHPIGSKGSYKLGGLLNMWTKVWQSELLNRSFHTAITGCYFYWDFDGSGLLGPNTNWDGDDLRLHGNWCDDLVESNVLKNIISNHHSTGVLVKRFAEWALKINTNAIFAVLSVSRDLWILVNYGYIGGFHNADWIFIERNSLFGGSHKVHLDVVAI